MRKKKAKGEKRCVCEKKMSWLCTKCLRDSAGLVVTLSRALKRERTIDNCGKRHVCKRRQKETQSRNIDETLSNDCGRVLSLVFLQMLPVIIYTLSMKVHCLLYLVHAIVASHNVSLHRYCAERGFDRYDW